MPFLDVVDPAFDRKRRPQVWHHAGRLECLLCHTTRSGTVQGFRLPQIPRGDVHYDLRRIRRFVSEQRPVLIAVDAGRMMTQQAGELSRFEHVLASALVLADVDLDVAGARYDEQLGEFTLPYREVRTAADPDQLLAEFVGAMVAKEFERNEREFAERSAMEAGARRRDELARDGMPADVLDKLGLPTRADVAAAQAAADEAHTADLSEDDDTTGVPAPDVGAAIAAAVSAATRARSAASRAAVANVMASPEVRACASAVSAYHH